MQQKILGKVIQLFICPEQGQAMQNVPRVSAITGKGLQGDRYTSGSGSWNKDHPGKRQVTLITLESFKGTEFSLHQSRRNIITQDVEVNSLLGKYFEVGEVLMRGVKYCDPCGRIDTLSGKTGFRTAFFERGGIIAEIFSNGQIEVYDQIILSDYNTG